jgi:hypothetical protein
MEASSDLARDTFASWLRASAEAKLGRCTRCMAASALLLAVGCFALVGVARMENPVPGLIAAATAFVVLALALAVAHGVALALRRLEVWPPADGLLPDPVEPGRSPSDAPQRSRGCGCGR